MVSVSPTPKELSIVLAIEAARLQKLTRHEAILRGGGSISGFLFVASLFIFFKAEYWKSGVPSISVLSAYAMLVIAVVVFASTAAVARVHLKDVLASANSDFVTSYSLEAMPNAFSIENRYGRDEILWNSVARIVATPEHTLVIFIFPATLIVPSRCFQSEAEYGIFVTQLQSYASGRVA